MHEHLSRTRSWENMNRSSFFHTNGSRSFITPALVALLAMLTSSNTAPAGETFRLVSYNIHHGEGMDRKLDLARIAGFLKAQQPDVVALQEVDRNCGRTGKVDQVPELARLTGMSATFQKAMDYDGGEYGICFLTKAVPLESKGIILPPGGEPRVGQTVKVPAFGGTLTVANTHLDFAKGAARLNQAQALLKALGEGPGTVLLAGDFNAVRGDEVMTAVTAAGWAVPVKQGPAATIPSPHPDREIDFAVFRPSTALKVLKYSVLDEAVFSDHRAILIEVTLPSP
jgi:endonuclease/exonuclease/phosphatase family metal-dependent hydrolase